MKYPAIPKRFRPLYVTTAAIMLFIAAIFTVVLITEDFTQEGDVVIIVLFSLIIALLIAGAAFLFIAGLSQVTLDENGVSLYFGKIKLNGIGWTDVKRVEVVFAGSNIWIINIMRTEEKSFSFKRARFIENTNKKRITLMYDKQALEIIRRHYDGEIYSPQPM